MVTQEFWHAKFGPRLLYSCTLNMIWNMLTCLVNQIAEVWLHTMVKLGLLYHTVSADQDISQEQIST